MTVQVPVVGSYSSELGRAPLLSPPRDEHLAVGQLRRCVISARAVETAGGRPGPAGRIVQFRARGSVEIAIESPCHQRHAVWEQRRSVQIACGAEAIRDRPTPAIRVRWRFDTGSTLADNSLTSLSPRAGHHLDDEK